MLREAGKQLENYRLPDTTPMTPALLHVCRRPIHSRVRGWRCLDEDGGGRVCVRYPSGSPPQPPGGTDGGGARRRLLGLAVDFFKRRRVEKKADSPRKRRFLKIYSGLMAPFAFISLPDRLPVSTEYQTAPLMEPAPLPLLM